MYNQTLRAYLTGHLKQEMTYEQVSFITNIKLSTSAVQYIPPL